MAAGTYSFKGTADMSQHDSSIQKSAKEVKKYEDQVKSANKEANKMGQQDFSGAYRSQKKMTDGVKGFTNAMNGASRGLTGMIGKAGIWGAAIAGTLVVGKKALDGLANRSDTLKDQMTRDAAGIKAGWDLFLNSLANFDFTNFLSNLHNAVKEARTLADILDQQQTFQGISNVELANLQNEFERNMMALENARNKYNIAKKQKNNSEADRWKNEMDRLEGMVSNVLERINALYKRQLNIALNAAKSDAKKYGFGQNTDMGLSDNIIRTMNTIVADEIRKSGGKSEHYSNWATFGKYLDSGGNPNWGSNAQSLAKILDNLNKLFYVHNGDIYETRNMYDPATGKTINGGYLKHQGIPGAEWSAMYEEVLQEMKKIFGLSDVSLGSEGRGEAIKAANSLVRFNEALRDAIDQMNSDENNTFTEELMQAAQAESAYLANMRRFNQAQNRDDRVVATANGPSYAKNTIGWYQKEITRLQEDLKKTGDAGIAAGIQKRIEEYQDAINKISMGEGSIEYITSRMKTLRGDIDKTSVTAVNEAGENARQSLLDEYYSLAEALLNLQWPEDTPQWVQGQISLLQEKMGDALDDVTREGIQAEIDSYNHVLDQLLYSGDRLGFINAELKQYQDEAARTTGERYDNAIANINRLNHELNDLQNKKGSINWISQEISLLNNQLNATDSIDDIERIVKEIIKLEVQLKSLQKLTETNIVIKTQLDLDEEALDRFADATDNVVNGLHSIGNAFNDFATIKQGAKEWNDLTEAEKEEIETLQQVAAAWNGLVDIAENVAKAFEVWQNGINVAARQAEVLVIQQENAALAENNALKTTNALASGENAIAEGSETAARITNTATMEAEGMVASSVASTKTAEAVAGGSASAAKLPFPYNIAAIAAVLAALGSVISLVANMSKFADGGIVGGNSFFGDHMIARVNSGEMILNRGQQARLFNLLNGAASLNGGNVGGNVTFHISGTDLIGVLNNNERTSKRIR